MRMRTTAIAACRTSGRLPWGTVAIVPVEVRASGTRGCCGGASTSIPFDDAAALPLATGPPGRGGVGQEPTNSP